MARYACEDALQTAPPKWASSVHNRPATRDALFFPCDGSLDRLVRRLSAAESSIDAAVYTITDERLTRSLLERHRAGAYVRVVSDAEQAFATGSRIFELARAGVSAVVGGHEREDSQARMHHKFVLVDKRLLLTGSFNWTVSAHARGNCNLPQSRAISLRSPHISPYLPISPHRQLREPARHIGQ